MAVEHHSKYLRRMADIFKIKSQKEGKKVAEEWASRTLTPTLIKQVAQVLQQGNK